jgi:hypothetical protein
MFEQLKQYETDHHSLDELVALEAFGRLVRQGFESRAFEAPAWLDDTLRAISSEIAVMARGALELRLREARARVAVNLSRDERKEQAQKEVERLEKLLSNQA